MSETVTSDQPQKQLAMHEFIPEGDLEDFWAEVVNHVGQDGESLYAQFQDFMLVMNIKDVKLRTKAPTFSQCHTQFVSQLHSWFHLQHVDLEQTWVDIALKDCPPNDDINTPHDHTLLCCTGCLSHWLCCMRNSKQNLLIQPQYISGISPNRQGPCVLSWPWAIHFEKAGLLSHNHTM